MKLKYVSKETIENVLQYSDDYTLVDSYAALLEALMNIIADDCSAAEKLEMIKDIRVNT